MQWSSPLPLCLGLAALVWSLQHVHAQPYRAKRVSDQRLAELETLLFLARLNREMQLHQPVGYGVADPSKLGRRKRTISSVWEWPPSAALFNDDDPGSRLPAAVAAAAVDQQRLSLSDRFSPIIA